MFKAAYGGGYRAGLAPKPIIVRPDGTKVLAFPDCPFKGRWQILSRYYWYEGYRAGMIESNLRWINSRQGVRYVL